MKKIICAVLCIALLVCIFVFAKRSKNADETVAEISSSQAGDSSKETTTKNETTKPAKETEPETTKQKKGSLKDTVKITIPLAVLDEKYQKDLKAYCEDYGYTKAKLNRLDRTVTVTMKAFSHELLLTQIGMKVVGALYEIAGSKDYPYINKIESFDNDNFKSVVYSVDAKKYPKESLSSYMMAQSCLLYQLYTEDTDYRVDITVIDKKTGKEIETITYTDKEILR